MSKCQKNKYAAGGKCGSMSGSANGSCSTNPEVNSNFAALLASREKQDALLFSNTQPKTLEPKHSVSQAIIIKKTIAKSDIDTVLEGDF
jgi:hypothetical protein